MDKTKSRIMSKISSRRSFIMGIAILWVMFFHIKDYMSGYGFLQETGYGGVDIFILLSGFGCYYSLNKDEDILSFFKRRMIRILPSYLPFIMIWMIVRYITYQLYFTEICGNLTMTGWWNNDGNQFNWYVDVIVFFYLLAPYVFKVISRSKKPVRTTIILMLIAFLIGFSFMHGLLLTGISRLPLFILGMFLARYLESEEKTIFPVSDKVIVMIINLLMIVGFASLYYFLEIQTALDKWHYGLWWYPFILIAPGLVYDIAVVGDVLSKNRLTGLFSLCIEEIGKASFELFLIHIFIFESFGKTVSKDMLPLLFIAALVLGYVYHMAVIKLTPVLKPKSLNDRT